MNKLWRAALMLILPAAFAAGCGTPEEVRDYAKTAGLQINSIRQSLKNVSPRETGVIEARRLIAQDLNREAISGESELDKDMQAVRDDNSGNAGECGPPCAASMFDVIVERYAQQEKAAEEAAQADQAFLDDFNKKLKSVSDTTTTSSSLLEAAGKDASAMSDEMSKQELSAFLFRYFKQVKSSFDEGRKQADAAASAEANESAKVASDSSKAVTFTNP